MRRAGLAIVLASGASLAIGFGAGMITAGAESSEDPSGEFAYLARLFPTDTEFATVYSLEWKGHGRITAADGDHDCRIDLWSYFENGEELYEVQDTNADGKLDYWWRYLGDDRGVYAVDDNFDGLVDESGPTTTIRSHGPIRTKAEGTLP